MSPKLEFECLPTAIGSMPHSDPQQACALVLKYLPDIPAWPQLPRRSPRENMVVQFSEGFPGVVIRGDRVQIKRSANFESELGRVQTDCEENNFQAYAVSDQYAAGLHAFLAKAVGSNMVKGQLTGPVTWGLTVVDEAGLGILHDDTLAETVAKFLRLKASWQENTLKRISPRTMVFVDEPYLVSLGSVFAPIPEDKVPILLEEVFAGIMGVKGLHCCGGTDWSLLLRTKFDVLSFDAYNYASSFSTHADKVKSFLERGGAIAWGIVPNQEDMLAKETVASLRDRLEEALAPFTRDGLRFRQIIAQGLITPSCGLASLSLEAASRALELTATLSRYLRARYAV